VLLPLGVGVTANADSALKATTPQVARAATSAPATAFQCEKKYKQAQGRERCFNQLPGSSCKHPLEVTKNNPYLVGDTKYLFVGLTITHDADLHGATQHWTWKTKGGNVAPCPYPKGVALRIFRGEELVEEIPQSVRSGHLDHHVTEVFDASLTLRGYFIHPPWKHRG
jgi:hypothetical protein